jgi:hypothetical protein
MSRWPVSEMPATDPTLLERADEIQEWRHRRYDALYRHLVDDQDKDAAKELDEAETFLARVDQKELARMLRQERDALVAEYSRRVEMLEQRLTDPPEADVAAAQMAKNLERHGRYLRDSDLDKTSDEIFHGAGFRRAPKPVTPEPVGPPPITDDERPYG